MEILESPASHWLAVTFPPLRGGKKVKVIQLCLTLCDPMGIQAMEFSRPEYWSG